MSTTNEHKRRKYSDGEKNNNKKKSPDSASDVEESDSSADESSSGGDGSSHSPCPFVAWLEEDPKVGDNKSHNVVLSVGELHFSSAEQLCCAIHTVSSFGCIFFAALYLYTEVIKLFATSA